MKHIVNDALRHALVETRPSRGRIRIVGRGSAVRPGVALSSLHQLADELEGEAVLAVARRPR
jgi:hypothetical protein